MTAATTAGGRRGGELQTPLQQLEPESVDTKSGGERGKGKAREAAGRTSV